MRRDRLLWILLLFLSGLLLAVSLWNLDWALWRHDFYLYYPPFFWHVRASEVYGLGFWVNVQYFQIAIAFILAIVSTYVVSKGKPIRSEE